ncbi:hypothetical protein H0H92_008352 [Tricholoma furcatifolium]|nr:hypothetical protein H0H92_008352 [Tricholoma furcatifolium]
MAQQRKALWNTEADLDEDVDLHLAIGNYGQSGHFEDGKDEISLTHIQQPQIDEHTLMAMQQHMAQQAAFSQIPDVVKAFIVRFHQAVLDNNLEEITIAYESGWNKYTEKFYSRSEWPEAEIIAPLVNDDPVFLILYRELYYRHVYSRLTPDIDDRFHSYENSCELFNYLLNSEGPVQLQLPEQWLWDIIDEFIYQFQVFCTWRSKVKSKTEDELMILAEGGPVWSSYSVLNVLYSLIQKSRINEYLVAQQQGKSPEEIAEIVGEYGQRPLYRNLGYFSLIGLLRVHVLLGDFTLALKVMENVELNQKSPFTRVTACHVATYYYVGFCYIMLRRYPDAIRTFVSVLNFMMRMKQYHTRSYQYDQISKTGDRMYALFAICNALSPSRLDDNVANNSKERFGDQFAKMARGGPESLPAFEELFLYASPKFITANPPPYEDPAAINALLSPPTPTDNQPSSTSLDPTHRHLNLFLADVAAQTSVPTLRSFLRLYTSLGAAKLANFLDADEEEIVQEMMLLKQASKSLSRVPGTDRGSLLDGETITTSDLNFVIAENMVHITESTIGRRYAGWFIKNTERAARIYDDLKSMPLPQPKTASAPAASNAAPAAETQSKGSRTGGQKVAWGGAKCPGPSYRFAQGPTSFFCSHSLSERSHRVYRPAAAVMELELLLCNVEYIMREFFGFPYLLSVYQTLKMWATRLLALAQLVTISISAPPGFPSSGNGLWYNATADIWSRQWLPVGNGYLAGTIFSVIFMGRFQRRNSHGTRRDLACTQYITTTATRGPTQTLPGLTYAFSADQNLESGLPIPSVTCLDSNTLRVRGVIESGGLIYEILARLRTTPVQGNNQTAQCIQQPVSSGSPPNATLQLPAGAATEAWISWVGDTEYSMDAGNAESGYSFRGSDPHNALVALISSPSVGSASWATILDQHVTDYKAALTEKFSLSLGQTPRFDAPTDVIQAAYQVDIGDRYLEWVLFNYGRYMLASSSRGSLPANLQGKWANGYSNAWSADYHSNINLQMNYWAAEMSNLDVTIPLFNYIEKTWAPRGCAHAQQLIWQLFNAVEKGFAASAKRAQMDKGIHIGSWGQLQEWKVDQDSPTDTHRHLSHLVGLYPGYAITNYDPSVQVPSTTKQQVIDAATISLIHRGNGTGPDADSGWEKVWRAAAWAQLGNASEFYHELSYAINRNFGANLFSLYDPFDADPIFQIDANLGYPAALLNGLIQAPDVASYSTPLTVTLLPALPLQWPSGSITGARVRGGLTVDFQWNNGKLSGASFTADASVVARDVNVAYNGKIIASFTTSGGFVKSISGF